MPYQRGRACAQNEEKEICCKQTTDKPARQTQHWVSGAAGAAWGHVSGLIGAVGRRTFRGQEAEAAGSLGQGRSGTGQWVAGGRGGTGRRGVALALRCARDHAHARDSPSTSVTRECTPQTVKTRSWAGGRDLRAIGGCCCLQSYGALMPTHTHNGRAFCSDHLLSTACGDPGGSYCARSF
jgi:hypothetical protein